MLALVSLFTGAMCIRAALKALQQGDSARLVSQVLSNALVDI
jgi:hypothetical protein